MKKLSFFVVLIYIVAVFGWCRCVYQFVKCDFDSNKSWKAELIYGVGTFTGAGAVIGYFNFGK